MKKNIFKSSLKVRKTEHLDLAKSQDSFKKEFNSLDQVKLPYNALPEIDFNEIDISISFLNKHVSAPFLITGMTGGTERSDKINEALVVVAEKNRLPLGIGSQRTSLASNESQSNLRKLGPNIPLIGNLGGVQLSLNDGIDLAKKAVDDIEADALAIHLNPLQEIIQPEGNHNWKGVLKAISSAVRSLPCPIIVKEVGRGLSAEVIYKLNQEGVEIFDVSGMGGTNWAKIEIKRRSNEDQTIYQPFSNIGINLNDAVIDARALSKKINIIASGGIRNGLDGAKTIWLGANMFGMAGELLKVLENKKLEIDKEKLNQFIKNIKLQTKISLFSTGCKDLKEFKKLAINYN